MSRVVRTPVLVLSSLMFAGCATQETFQVRIMRPAPVDLGRYDLIAVDRFDGNGSEQVSAELTDALRAALNPMTGQSDFDVLDRRDVDEMLDDLRKNRGDEWDQRSMSVLEKWRTAQILIKGDVQVYDVDEQVYEEETVDVQGFSHVRVTRVGNARLSVVIEATDTEGDRVFDTVQYDESATDSRTAIDADPGPVDHEALLASVRRQVVDRYMNRVMPHEEFVRVMLFTDGDVPELQIGNGFARTGDWEEATRSYQDGVERATGELGPVRYKALYNLGVAYEYTNEFDQAKQSLKQAYALEQDEAILRELERVNGREQEFRLLSEQGQRTARPQR